MIPIIKEPKELQQNTRLYEQCYFCHKPTDTWHTGTNQPVCEGCSKTHKVSELVKSSPDLHKNKSTNFFNDWATVISGIELRKSPKRSLLKRKPFKKWTAEEYDMAANAVQDAMQLTTEEWSVIRLAIRRAVECNS